jgi:hypothetical protein
MTRTVCPGDRGVEADPGFVQPQAVLAGLVVLPPSTGERLLADRDRVQIRHPDRYIDKYIPT